MKYTQLRVQAEVGNLLFTGDPETRSRVDFEFTQAVDDTPKGTLTLYNPPDGFAAAVRKRTFVRVSAGWDGSLGTVFAGYPIADGVDVSVGRDITVTVKVMPNVAEKWRKAVALTPRGQMSYQDALTYLIESMGLTVGTLDLANAPAYLARGYAFEGPGWRALRTLAMSAGAEVVFNGDVVDVLRPDVGAPSTETVPHFTQHPDNGSIIGEVKHTDKGIEIETLFDPRLQVGRRAAFEWYDVFSGRYVEGVFVVRGVKHAGSSHGTERTTRVTARRVGGL